jgi:hypothetical protein
MSRTQASGLVAAIRPARATDLPALGEFFAELSVQTRYLRFFSPIRVGPSLLSLLCGGDEVRCLGSAHGPSMLRSC